MEPTTSRYFLTLIVVLLLGSVAQAQLSVSDFVLVEEFSDDLAKRRNELVGLEDDVVGRLIDNYVQSLEAIGVTVDSSTQLVHIESSFTYYVSRDLSNAVRDFDGFVAEFLVPVRQGEVVTPDELRFGFATDDFIAIKEELTQIPFGESYYAHLQSIKFNSFGDPNWFTIGWIHFDRTPDGLSVLGSHQEFTDISGFNPGVIIGEVSACNRDSLGDIDQSGRVDFADFLILSHNFGQEAESHKVGDLNCDGTVAFADFLLLSRNFGRSPLAFSSVPEPMGVVGLCWLCCFLLARRRRIRTSTT